MTGSGTLQYAGTGSLTNVTLSAGATGSTVELGTTYGSQNSLFTLHGKLTVAGPGTAIVYGQTVQAAAGESVTVTNPTGSAGTLMVQYNLNNYAGQLNAAAGGTLTLNMTGAGASVVLYNGAVGNTAGSVVNVGNFNWAGGTIGATGGVGGLVNNSAAFAVTGGGTLYGTLTNNATIVHSGGGVSISNGGVLANPAGSVYDFTTDNASIYGSGGVVSNGGLFEKTGGVGGYNNSTVSATFNDTGGTVLATAGTLNLNGGGTLSATTLSASATGAVQYAGTGSLTNVTLSPSVGATVDLGTIYGLQNSALTLHGQLTVAGAGAAVVYGQTVQAAAGESVTIANPAGSAGMLAIYGNSNNYPGQLNAAAGGTLTLNLTGTGSSVVLNNSGIVGNGVGAVLNVGNFNWSGGSIGASGGIGGIVNNSATFAITNGGSLYGTLTNNGTITHSGGGVTIYAGGVLSNPAGSVYNFTADNAGIYGNGGMISNAGLFEKTGGAGGYYNSIISATFNDTAGTVLATAGILNLNGGGTLSGTTLSATGNGTVQFAGTGSLTNVTLSTAAAGSTVDLGTTYGSQNSTLTLHGQLIVNGPGAAVVYGQTVQAAAGESVTVVNPAGSAGTLVVYGNSNNYVGQLNAAAGGTLTLDLVGVGASVGLYNGGTIGNAAGAVVNVGNFNWSGGSITALVNNSATFVITNGGGLPGKLTNNGTITHSGGGVTLYTGGVLSNPAGSVYNLTTDNATISGNGGIISNAGLFEKTGGAGGYNNSTVSATFNDTTGTVSATAGVLNLNGGGTLSGTTLTATGTAVVQYAGTGSLTNVILSAAASGATVDLGTTYGSQSSVLTLHGKLTVAGPGTAVVYGQTVQAAAGESVTVANLTGSVGTLVVYGNNNNYAGQLNAAAGGTLTLNMTGTGSSVVLYNSGVVGNTAGSVVNTGNFNWSGGNIGATGSIGGLVNNSATFAITNGGNLYGTLTNNGTITHSGGGVTLYTGGLLSNQTGSTYNLTTDNAGIYGSGGTVLQRRTVREDRRGRWQLQLDNLGSRNEHRVRSSRWWFIAL